MEEPQSNAPRDDNGYHSKASPPTSERALPLYCVTRNADAPTPKWLQQACTQRSVSWVAVDPRDPLPLLTAGDGLLRCDGSEVARQAERALVDKGVLHVFATEARAMVEVDVHLALSKAGLPVVPALRVGRTDDRDRLRAQVASLGGLPVTLVSGRRDGTRVPLDSMQSLLSVVDYLSHRDEALWLCRGDAWHVLHDVYVLERRLLGGIDRWPWSTTAYLSPPGFDDVLALQAARVLGLRFAVVTLAWGPQGRPHVHSARVPDRFDQSVGEQVSRQVVSWLCDRGLA